MKSWLLAIVAGMCLFAVFFPIMEAHTQSFRFVDEEEHIVIADLMNRGKRLYTDISTNHQPLNYIVSSLVLRVFKPTNVFMVIKRHREIVFVWSAIWAIIILRRFGWRSLPFISVFELLKYFLLGNEFLAESFAAYPLAYWMGSTIYDPRLRHRRLFEDIFLGGIGAVAVFFSLPLAVPVALMAGWRLLLSKGKSMLGLVVGGVVVVGALLLWIHPADYWRESVQYNYAYVAPSLTSVHSLSDAVLLWLLPFLYWSIRPSLLVWAVRGVVVVWGASLLWWILRREWKWVGMWGLCFFIWGASNSRDIVPGQYFYSGFHLLPWFAVGLFGGLLLWIRAVRSMPRIGQRLMWGGLIASLLLLISQPDLPLWRRPNPEAEHHVQFNSVTQITRVLSLVTKPGDRLMVLPSQSITHWTTQLLPATRQVTYYDWQYFPTRNQLEYEMMLATQPPEFIQFTDDYSHYVPSVQTLLDSSYSRLFTTYENTTPTGIYVRKDRFEAITPEQWRALVALDLPIEGVRIQL